MAAPLFQPQRIETAAAVAARMGEHGWEVAAAPDQDDRFRIVSRELGEVQVIDRWLGSCRGRRSAGGVGASQQPFLAFLYVVSGREKGIGEGRELCFEPGDTSVWHSSQSIEFEVLEPLHKLIFVIPESRLGGLFPDGCAIRDIHIKRHSELGPFVSSHLATLASNLDSIGGQHATSILDMTLEILAHAVAAGRAVPDSRSGDLVATRILAFVDKHLEDPDLSPTGIADAHGVSLRYLHLLFARRNLTVSGRIRERRLLRCRAALEREGRGARVSEIAYRWGFKDPAHFSRLFKKRFGIAPTQIRSGGALRSRG